MKPLFSFPGLWLLGLMVCSACAIAVAESGPVNGQAIMLEDFEMPGHWSTWAGDSDPRPTGGMKAVSDQPHGGKHCGSFYFDTTCDHGYVSTDLVRAFPPKVVSLRFWVRCPGKVNLTVRLVDSTGQTHQRSVPQAPGPWRQVMLDLTKPWPHHYGGANDARFHQPFVRI